MDKERISVIALEMTVAIRDTHDHCRCFHIAGRSDGTVTNHWNDYKESSGIDKLHVIPDQREFLTTCSHKTKDTIHSYKTDTDHAADNNHGEYKTVCGKPLYLFRVTFADCAGYQCRRADSETKRYASDYEYNRKSKTDSCEFECAESSYEINVDKVECDHPDDPEKHRKCHTYYLPVDFPYSQLRFMFAVHSRQIALSDPLYRP